MRNARLDEAQAGVKIVRRKSIFYDMTARRSNQSILKEISPGISLEGMMLKLNPVLWPPHAKSWLIGKYSDAGRDWGQEEKGTTEDEMAGWHHQLHGHEPEWTQGLGDGQGGLACCVSWSHKESDMDELLNWTELNWTAKDYYIIQEIYNNSAKQYCCASDWIFMREK